MNKYVLLSLLSSLLLCPLFGQNQLAIPDTAVGPVINLNLQTGSVNFYTAATQTMGANGDILGPTLILQKGDSVTINVTNNLPDTTTVHWHGLHVSPENDGGPHSIIPVGTTWTSRIEVMDHAATYWYHPHLHMHTNEHVTKGLAGFIYVRDSEEAALTLPRTYGVDDIPLVVQSRSFDSGSQFTHGNAYDTVILVNGTKDPFVDLPAQVVRLRLLNGSSERVYNFGFSDNRSFQMIASDGGLLNAPVSMTRLRLAPGERAEILVDLQGALGQTLYLMSYAATLASGIYGAAQPGMGPGQTIPGYTSNPLNGANFNLLQINVVAQSAGAVTTIPSTLVTNTPWSVASASTTRTLTFTPQTMGPTAIQGPFFINGTTFDMQVINYTIPLGSVEIWTLTNNSPIAHPFHIHDVQFYVLDRNGQTPAAHEQGRKDVILVESGGGTVRFITKFEDFASDTMPYMYHCHMLTHEDDGMMGQFLVVDTSTVTGLNVSSIKKPIAYQFFPNPMGEEGLLVFDNPENLEVNLAIYNVQGSIVRQAQYSGTNQIVLKRDGLQSGFYFFRLQRADGEVLTVKFMLE